MENQNTESDALQIKKLEYSLTEGAQMEQRLRILASQARMYAGSTIVPKTFMGNEGNCAIAIDMATRMQANPLMIMQNLYIVNGQPSFSSKFLIAALNTTGKFSPLDYEFRGEQGTDGWGCRACAIRLADRKKLQGPWATIEMAKKEGWTSKSGSKWLTMPELMLRYRAAAFFQRTYAPEVSMGFLTTEELNDQPETIDTTYEEIKETKPRSVADVIMGATSTKETKATAEQPKVEEPKTEQPAPAKPTIKELNDKLRNANSDITPNTLFGNEK